MQVQGVLYLKLTAENGESATTSNQLPATQMEKLIQSTVEGQQQPPDHIFQNCATLGNQNKQQNIPGRAQETNLEFQASQIMNNSPRQGYNFDQEIRKVAQPGQISVADENEVIK